MSLIRLKWSMSSMMAASGRLVPHRGVPASRSAASQEVPAVGDAGQAVDGGQLLHLAEQRALSYAVMPCPASAAATSICVRRGRPRRSSRATSSSRSSPRARPSGQRQPAPRAPAAVPRRLGLDGRTGRRRAGRASSAQRGAGRRATGAAPAHRSSRASVSRGHAVLVRGCSSQAASASSSAGQRRAAAGAAPRPDRAWR